MYTRMQHLNGDIFAAIDVETTGGLAGFHEVVQIAILPLDSNLDVIPVTPFNIKIKPSYPERAEKEAMKVNRLDLDELYRTGFDRVAAIDLLHEWIEHTLELGYNKWGTKSCRLRPVGHNYAGFDQAMVKAWLDIGTDYHEIFYPHCEDTMIEGNSTNLKLAMRGREKHFEKVGLNAMCKKMGVPYEPNKHHDALYDAHLTAQLFKKLMTTDIVGLFT